MERKIDGSHVLAVCAGLALGGLAGYLLGRKAAKKDVEWRIASEVEGVREHYKAKLDAVSAAAANAARKGSNPDEAETGPVGDGEPRGNYDPGARPGDSSEAGDNRVLPEGPLGFVPDQAGPDDPGRRDPLAGLPGARDEEDDYDDEEDHDDGADDPDFHDGSTRQSPYVISLEDFTDQEESFRKVTIYWYAEDEVLVDEREEPIPDVRATVGEEFKTQFASNSSTGGPSEPVAYVRNRRLHCDFEVALREGSYIGEVLNYGRPK